MSAPDKIEKEIEILAKMMRKNIRKKAGLQLDWDKASDKMKEWYRSHAKELMAEELSNV